MDDELRELQEGARQEKVLFDFFRRHPHVLPIGANRAAILRYFADAPISASTLEAALLSDPRLRSELAFQTPARPEETEPEPLQELPGQIPAHITGKVMRQMAAIHFRRLIDVYGEDAVMSRYSGKD